MEEYIYIYWLKKKKIMWFFGGVIKKNKTKQKQKQKRRTCTERRNIRKTIIIVVRIMWFGCLWVTYNRVFWMLLGIEKYSNNSSNCF